MIDFSKIYSSLTKGEKNRKKRITAIRARKEEAVNACFVRYACTYTYFWTCCCKYAWRNSDNLVGIPRLHAYDNRLYYLLQERTRRFSAP